MADEEEKDDGLIEAEPVKSSNKTVMIMVLLSLAVIALTPFSMWYLFVASSPNKTQEKVNDTPPEIIEVILPKVDVNVAGTKGTRVVQIQCVLRLSAKALEPHFAEKPDGTTVNLVNRAQGIVLSIAKTKTLDALDSPGADKRLQKELKIALNEMLINDLKNPELGEINDIYFKYFLMQ